VLPKDFRNLSAHVGSNPLHIQGSGGNTSIKNGSTLWVKASGMCLRDAIIKDIFCPVDINSGEPLTNNKCSKAGLRPSIETVLHLSLPHKYVFHTHSTVGIAASLARKKLPESHVLCHATYIPYADPGCQLASAIYSSSSISETNIYLLENHGLVIASNSLATINHFFSALDSADGSHLRSFPPPNIPRLNAILSTYPQLSLPKQDLIHALATDRFCLKQVSESNPPTPDHLIFCGIRPFLASSPSIELKHVPNTCMYIVIEDCGVLLTAGASSFTSELLESLADIYLRCSSDSSITCLSDSTCQELLGWESEAYRLSLARAK